MEERKEMKCGHQGRAPVTVNSHNAQKVSGGDCPQWGGLDGRRIN
jgi:hypothetical protein